ncbi:hypothetical protein [Corynebacterium sp. A21]|uniref:hypothetical protein n=1 Tax=Corynebacterium sp. A21 TaxID=3457318 RepID=UPI003FCFA1EC
MRHPFRTILLLATATLLTACTGAGTGTPTETVTVTEGPGTSAATSTPTTPTTSSPTDPFIECTPEALARDIDPGLDTVLYCDGQWLRGGRWQTDWVIYAFWNNGRWVEYEAHGSSEVTEYPCFDLDRARADGAPEEILGMMAECD